MEGKKAYKYTFGISFQSSHSKNPFRTRLPLAISILPPQSSNMAPVSFDLVALNSEVTDSSFLAGIQGLTGSERPLYVGKCQHWIHAPHLSSDALGGNGSTMKRWDYLLVRTVSNENSLGLPHSLRSGIANVWSITGDVDDNMLSTYHRAQQARSNAPAPSLPDGWSPADHKGLDAAEVPPDLEASLALPSYPLGSSRDGDRKPLVLKDFVRDFGKHHMGAVNMFNLLSFEPNQKPRYFQYIAAFSESVGSKYGGDAMFIDKGDPNWSSKADEANQVGDWEHFALIHYPSIWHFAKMLDDPGYADADRRFKQGALRDNPILCCTEVTLDFKE